MPWDRLLAAAESAELLVNISGHLTLPRLLGAFRRRVMVDIDPGFTQFWHDAGLAGAHVEGHDVYFTIGELIGTRACPVPTGGIEWLTVRQPVVLTDWPMVDAGLKCRGKARANFDMVAMPMIWICEKDGDHEETVPQRQFDEPVDHALLRDIARA